VTGHASGDVASNTVVVTKPVSMEAASGNILCRVVGIGASASVAAVSILVLVVVTGGVATDTIAVVVTIGTVGD
jgi:hypothetical protein